MTHHDVVVLGLGGMGSAAAAHLAGRGRRVLGLEQFTPAHALGSSHGESRIIRQAYFEGAEYVPLLLRAYELYADLDRDDPGLFARTGGLMLGTEHSATVAGSRASAERWGLPHEVLDATQLRRRVPGLRPTDETVGVYERAAGYVRPERTVRAHLDRAARRGAELRFGEPALSWSADADHVTVTTSTGTHHAEHLVVTAGAWAPTVLAELGLPLVVERQLLHWFTPLQPELFDPVHFPIYIWELGDGSQLYGFPRLDGSPTVKTAFFRAGHEADPDRLDRTVHADEVAAMRAALERFVPAAAGAYDHGVACMYTTTPDEHFVIAPHPQHPRVVVAAGFSGHGFKFTPVVGEVLADLVTSGSTRHPIDLFDPARFAAPTVGTSGSTR